MRLHTDKQLALIYINPSTAEVEAAFGPFGLSREAEEAFDFIREDPPCPNDWARFVTLTPVEVVLD